MYGHYINGILITRAWFCPQASPLFCVMSVWYGSVL